VTIDSFRRRAENKNKAVSSRLRNPTARRIRTGDRHRQKGLNVKRAIGTAARRTSRELPRSKGASLPCARPPLRSRGGMVRQRLALHRLWPRYGGPAHAKHHTLHSPSRGSFFFRPVLTGPLAPRLGRRPYRTVGNRPLFKTPSSRGRLLAKNEKKSSTPTCRHTRRKSSLRGLGLSPRTSAFGRDYIHNLIDGPRASNPEDKDPMKSGHPTAVNVESGDQRILTFISFLSSPSAHVPLTSPTASRKIESPSVRLGPVIYAANKG